MTAPVDGGTVAEVIDFVRTTVGLVALASFRPYIRARRAEDWPTALTWARRYRLLAQGLLFFVLLSLGTSILYEGTFERVVAALWIVIFLIIWYIASDAEDRVMQRMRPRGPDLPPSSET